jgi:hypothetical protein
MPRPTRLEHEIIDLTEAFALEVFTALRAGLDALFAEASSSRAARPGARRRRKALPKPAAGRERVRTSEEEARELLVSRGYGVRRSSEELHKLANEIIAIVKAHPKGIRTADIKAKMGFESGHARWKVFAKPLGLALASKKIRKTGQRNSTFYFAA